MAQSSWSAIVARIVAQIQTIADVGQVHDRRRLVKTESEFIGISGVAIGGVQQARMWQVFLESMGASFADASGALKWNRVAVIHGFLQLEDANSSETTAITLAESICRTLSNDLQATKLGGTVLSGAPARIIVAEPRFLLIVECNFVRIEMPLLTIEM
jgi:hypothetical protein